NPRPSKEQTVPSHCRHNTTEIALCKTSNRIIFTSSWRRPGLAGAVFPSPERAAERESLSSVSATLVIRNGTGDQQGEQAGRTQSASAPTYARPAAMCPGPGAD